MRTQATIISFVLVFAAYLGYGWILVPIVLPNTKIVHNPPPPPPIINPIRAENAHFLELLPENGWENDPNEKLQVLRLGQTLVFFGEDVPDANKLRLKPCTIIMLPSEYKEYRDEEETKNLLRQSVVMRTPEYAEIEFDADFDITKMSALPNFVAGRFSGKVTIHKNSSNETGEQDDFSLETEIVEIREDADSITIATIRDVRFKFGLHTGEGTGLTLRLAQTEHSPTQAGIELHSIIVPTLKLLRLVFPEDNSSIGVRCLGRFEFSANPVEQGWTGSFYHNVEMVRNNANNTVDRLTAEEVHLTLSGLQQTEIDTNKASQFDRLEPALFVARGRPGRGTEQPVPARLSVKQGGDVTLIGDEIFLNLRDNYLQLSTRKEPGASPFVEMIVADQYHIRSEHGVRYTFGQDLSAIGRLIADGKGNLTGRIGEGATAKDMRLDWNTMQMEPHPSVKDQLVLKMGNGISARMTGFGTMTAQQLELHCVTGAKNSMMLDHIVVRDNVRFETAAGTCNVNQMNVFFKNLASNGSELHISRMLQRLASGTPPIPPRMSSVMPPVGTQQPIQQVQHLQPLTPYNAAPQNPVAPIPLYSPPSPPVASPMLRTTTPQRTAPKGSLEQQNLMGIKSSPGGGKFDIAGNLLELEVRIQNGQSSAEIVKIDGNVRLTEKTDNAVPMAMPIEIIGESVRIWDPADPTTVLRIIGKTTGNEAIIKGRGVELRAQELNLSRGDNKFWSPGPGQLTAHVAQVHGGSVPSSNTHNDTLTVNWNKEMRCDGRLLQVEGLPGGNGERVNVTYKTQTLSQKMWCNEMELHLNRQVLFFDDPSNVPPEAVEIFCVGGVYVENQLLDVQGRKRSDDFARADKLRYNIPRNYFFAAGPGELSTVFIGSSQGFDSANLASTSGHLAGTPVNNGSETLTHLAVWFPDQMQGVLLGGKREVQLTGRKVRVAYCPASNWNDRVDIGSLSAARQRGYTLECELLKIEEMPNPLNSLESFFELTASQTAIIEGSGLFGKAGTIRYNQSKSTVDFDGNVSAQRTIQGQESRVGPIGRVVYNLETKNFEAIHIEQGMSLQ